MNGTDPEFLARLNGEMADQADGPRFYADPQGAEIVELALFQRRPQVVEDA